MRHDNITINNIFGKCLLRMYCFLQNKYNIKNICKHAVFFQSPLVQAIFSRDTEEVTFLLDHNQDASSLVRLPH